MTRRGYARQAGAGGADANGMTAADREAARNYRTRTLGGGLISRNYQRDVADISNAAPERAATAAGKSK